MEPVFLLRHLGLVGVGGRGTGRRRRWGWSLVRIGDGEEVDRRPGKVPLGTVITLGLETPYPSTTTLTKSKPKNERKKKQSNKQTNRKYNILDTCWQMTIILCSLLKTQISPLSSAEFFRISQ